jgi:hypothetical protein
MSRSLSRPAFATTQPAPRGRLSRVRPSGLACAITLVVLALAPAAHAATVTEATSASTRFTVTFAALPGEVNDLTVSMSGQSVTFSDSGAPLTARAGCTATDAHTVSCPATSDAGGQVVVTLDDEDDTARVLWPDVDGRPDPPDLTINGGLGNDTLSGAGAQNLVDLEGDDGNDVVTGGDSGDVVEGGNGDDTVDGGPGDDVIDGGPGNDHLIGGPGRDDADYFNEKASIRVDLAAGTESSADGNDTLTGLENVDAGAGDDVLLGDGNANTLNGGDGTDTADGRGGNDTIDAERATGGAGDDHFEEPRLTSDCGPGRDVVRLEDTLSSGQGPVIPPSCEKVQLSTDVTFEPKRITRSGATLVMRLSGLRRGRPAIKVRDDHGTLLASGAAQVADGRSSTARLKLTAAGRRRLAAGGHPALRISVVFGGSSFSFGTRLSG